MSELTDKIKGTANIAAGKAKRAIGDATDDADMMAKGAAQEIKGNAQKLKGAVKNKINKM
jgi:uncharacterized protein YjbJ (UPF0337 family)